MIKNKQWKEFILGNIIPDIHNAKSYNSSDLVNSNDENYILYITRTDNNNGISKFIVNDDYEGIEDGNAITIGDTTATIFYQDKKFIAGPHIIVLRAPWFNKYTALFIITILNMEKKKYPVFGRAFTKELIANTVVMLPIDKNENIDFKAMEDYIKSIECDITSIPDYFFNDGFSKVNWYMDNIDSDKFESEFARPRIKEDIKLTDRTWDFFELGDEKIFDIKRGESKYIKNMDQGEYRYISTSRENNGIATFVSEYNRKGNLLTLAYDGSIGSCFYQEKPFFASEKIVTIDLVGYKMNKYIAMFLIPIIQLESEMYTYGGRKWTVEEQLKKTKIKLPVDTNGLPDYGFMEKYIKSRPFSCNI